MSLITIAIIIVGLAAIGALLLGYCLAKISADSEKRYKAAFEKEFPQVQK